MNRPLLTIEDWPFIRRLLTAWLIWLWLALVATMLSGCGPKLLHETRIEFPKPPLNPNAPPYKLKPLPETPPPSKATPH